MVVEAQLGPYLTGAAPPTPAGPAPHRSLGPHPTERRLGEIAHLSIQRALSERAESGRGQEAGRLVRDDFTSCACCFHLGSRRVPTLRLGHLGPRCNTRCAWLRRGRAVRFLAGSTPSLRSGHRQYPPVGFKSSNSLRALGLGAGHALSGGDSPDRSWFVEQRHRCAAGCPADTGGCRAEITGPGRSVRPIQSQEARRRRTPHWAGCGRRGPCQRRHNKVSSRARRSPRAELS
jgi:hypothetical protein